MLVSTDFIFSYVSKCLVYDFQKQEQVAVEYTFYTDINTVWSEVPIFRSTISRQNADKW